MRHHVARHTSHVTRHTSHVTRLTDDGLWSRSKWNGQGLLTCVDVCLWFVVCGLWFVVCGLWFVVCGLWFVVCGLWFVVCGLWFVVCGLWFVVCGLWFVVCGLWFVVCGLWFWHYCDTLLQGTRFKCEWRGGRACGLGEMMMSDGRCMLLL